MKRGLFFRLALDGMKKNRRLYLPYLLTCAGMVMMEYILTSLAHSPLMLTMRGGDLMRIILLLGTHVFMTVRLRFPSSSCSTPTPSSSGGGTGSSGFLTSWG